MGDLPTIVTDAPTVSTDAPTSSPTTCVQNSEWRKGGDPKKHCEWVMNSNKENRRQRLCQKNGVRNNCPVSCGLCCADNAGFTFLLQQRDEYDNIREPEDCEWIGKQFDKRQRYCLPGQEKISKYVKFGCAKTCDLCP